MGICAESVEDSSEFNSDITSTNHDDPLGLFFNIKESIGVDTVRGSWNLIVGRDSRSTTDGDHDFLRFDLVFRSVLLGDFDSVRIDKFSPSIMVIYILLVQVTLANSQLMTP